MTPFPEAEIMTIKRLEVALRKMDFKLMKDGAYKLHEKYHSGHKFEYLDLLRDLLMEIENSPSVPNDVKDILCPTINDILSQDNFIEPVEQNAAPASNSFGYSTQAKEEFGIITDEPVEQIYEQSIAENFDAENSINDTPQFELEPEVKINAFDAFSPQKPQVQEQPQRYFTQSPFSAQPFKEFNPPTITPTATPSVVPSEQPTQVSTQAPMQIQQEATQAPVVQTPTFAPIVQEATVAPTIQEKKTISIFYSQDNSKEKIKNIAQLREMIATSREKNTSIDDFMALISEITTQANVNVIELQGILKQLSAKGSKTSLITNSQSEMLVELLDSIDITYSLFQNKENNKVTLIPLFGLSNLFYCAECGQNYLDKTSEVKPLVLECPQCKNPMYVDYWAANEKAELNLDYYNNALVNLANARVWLIIHPTYNDKISSKLIENALKVSKNVEEVYVLDKDINTRENYKNFISKINPNIKVNAHNNTLEEFFNNI